MTTTPADDFDLTPEQEAQLWEEGEPVELVAPWEMWTLVVGEAKGDNREGTGWETRSHGRTSDIQSDDSTLVVLPSAS